MLDFVVIDVVECLFPLRLCSDSIFNLSLHPLSSSTYSVNVHLLFDERTWFHLSFNFVEFVTWYLHVMQIVVVRHSKGAVRLFEWTMVTVY